MPDLNLLYQQIFNRIDRLLESQASLRIAIDGPAASGKSTLGALLAHRYDAALIHMDHFFLPPELRTPERYLVAGGNVDYERFAREVTPGLNTGTVFSYRTFDCSIMSFGPSIEIPPKRLTIVEGSYSLHPRTNATYDLKIFLTLSPDEQLRRLKLRNPKLLDRFVQMWIPMENQYFAEFGIQEKCDLVI